jgi:hypothetical protein
MKSIISPHWTQGGSGITNFEPEDLPLYEAAIKEFGCPSLVLSDKPMDGKNYGFAMYSLHDLRRSVQSLDISEFWKTFRRLQAQSVAA